MFLRTLRILEILLLAACASNVVSAAHHGVTSVEFSKCQTQTSDPLDGCPKNTLYVSQTDSSANFSTIQSAIDYIPHNDEHFYILIAPGNYTEQLNVTRHGPLYFLGTIETSNSSVPYSDIGYNTSHSNAVQIWWHSANFNSTFSDNVYTSTLIVAPTLNASLTGSGPTGAPVPADTPFGCKDFRAYNIDFRNQYVSYSDGPSLAITLARANGSFYSCGFYSWQDTIFVGKLGNAYYYDNIIAGQTDFLYGFGTAYFENTTLSLRGCGGGITAWKGTNTTWANKYGVYISDSRILAANESVLEQDYHTCALGRPWNSLDRTVYMNTYFDSCVLPAGFISWDSTRITNETFMAVWNNYGPGVNLTAETASTNSLDGYPITRVLNDSSPWRYPVDVFQVPNGTASNIAWIDKKYLVGPSS